MSGTSKTIIRVVTRVLLALIIILLSYLAVLTGLVIWAFEDKLQRWPVFVHCAPFTLAVGDEIDASGFLERLKRNGYVQSNDIFPEAGEWMLSGSTLRVFLTSCPLPGQGIVSGPVELTLDWKNVRSIKLLRSQDQVDHIEIEPELLDVLPVAGIPRELCRPLTLGSVKPLLLNAILLTEDPFFFSHAGVDTGSMVQAVKANFRAGRYVQGASTITQQLIRMTLLDREKSLWRKINEIFLSLLADAIYDKKTIIEAYLNRVYFGQWGGLPVKGVAEASRVFFGLDQTELEPAQCALLAAIIRAPNILNPYRHLERALSRRNMVLGLLLKAGHISREEYDHALTRPARMRRWEGAPVRAPAFLTAAKKQIEKDGSSGGASNVRDVITSLDPIIQEKALASLKRVGKDIANAYFILAGPETGIIQALITPTGKGWTGDGGDLGVLAPLVAIPALQPSARHDTAAYSLATPIFLPKDPTLPVPLRTAFLKDREFLVGRIMESVGTIKVQDALTAFGLSCRKGPGQSLDFAPISPLEMARIYSLLATLGDAGALHPYIKIIDARAAIAPVERVRCSTNPATLYLVNHLLKPTEAILLKEGRPDTSDRVPSVFTATDAGGTWCVAYRPDALCLVRISSSDVKRQEIEALVQVSLPPPHPRVRKHGAPPEGIISRKVCAESGLLATSLCREVLNGPFIKGTQPTEWCPLPHR